MTFKAKKYFRIIKSVQGNFLRSNGRRVSSGIEISLTEFSLSDSDSLPRFRSMIVPLGFINILKYRTLIAPFSPCTSEIFEFLLGSTQSCCNLKNTRAFNHGSKKTTFRNHDFNPKPSLYDSVRKNVLCVEKWNPSASCNGVNKFEYVVGHRWIHSDNSVEHLERSEEKSAIASTDGSGNEEKKKTMRKKLKGKRAVVRWLKFFRWKKKKEYERMTSEEKLLFKLNKVFH